MLIFAVVLALVAVVFGLRSVVISLRSTERIVERAGAELPFLSIVVPARNEAHQVGACVRSLLSQAYPAFEVVVVDDCSTDETARIVAELAQRDSRLRLVRGAALPQGWVGKPWALQQGVMQTRGDWLLFTDADTVHESAAARTAISYALSERIDAISLLTDQVMESAAERVVLPSILWTIIFGTGSLATVNDPKKPNALFNGQYIAMSRHAYDEIGGYTAVRGEIAEDLELARRFNADRRLRMRLVGGSGLVRTRMYRSFSEIWHGFVKNFALGVRGEPFLAAFAIAYFALLAPVLPLALIAFAASRETIPALIAGAALVIALAGAEFGMRRARFPRWSALWLPVGISVMVGIFVTSIAKHARGGVAWRGRAYGPNAPDQGEPC